MHFGALKLLYMVVNVEKLKSKVMVLDKTFDRYEEISLNLYNDISCSSMFWKDNNSKIFYENLHKLKLENQIFLLELSKTKKIINLILESYEPLGNKIEFYLENRSAIINKLDSCIQQLTMVEFSLKDIDLKYDFQTNQKIEYLKKLTLDSKQKLEDMKKIYFEYFNKIEAIEKKIKFEISKNEIKDFKLDM